MSKDGTAALSSTTVDDISQGIGSVDISNNNGTSAAAACDMSSSREEDTISEKKCTSCEHKIEHTKKNGIEVDVSTDDMVVSTCANCGKEGATNTCNKCKQVKYCNAVCKKRHRHKHKKDCEEHLKRAAELHEEELRRAAELHDVELFKDPPPSEEDCPICFQLLPWLGTGKRYQGCCGKMICSGCIYVMNERDENENDLCPFCRTPAPQSGKEVIKRMQKRVEADDAEATQNLAGYYSEGVHGLSINHSKALELWKRAAELGCGEAYYNIGVVYYHGEGVERDMNKARHYYELAAMRGCVLPRHNLGLFEHFAGNTDRALRHFKIAVGGGHKISLRAIQDYYSKGHATKDEYAEALSDRQKYLDEVNSIQRDEAAAAYEEYQYIE